VVYGEEMMDIKDLKRQGLNITQIAEIVGRDPKTIRKYLEQTKPPIYTPRPPVVSKLDQFKPYIRTRMVDDRMTNAVKMLAELQKKGYTGGSSILKDYMRPFRPTIETATARYETGPGEQAQVDWGHCGRIFHEGALKPLYCFVMTLGYSRYMYIEFTTSQDTTTFMRAHVNAFEFFGGLPEKILYDNTKSAIIRRFLKKIELNPRFADMAGYYGFIPRFCKPYRAQTKGKVESGVKYVKGNFLLGEVFSSLEEINAAARTWLAEVANVRIHGTTGEVPLVRFEKEALTHIAHLAPFDTAEHTYRRATLDCIISYRGSRYSVPHMAAKRTVLVKEEAGGMIHIFLDGESITSHRRAKKGQTVIVPDHYKGIAVAMPVQPRKLTIHGICAPQVEVRDLRVYEEACS
jgi:transposase